MNYDPPHLIELPRLGESALGFISIANVKDKLIPFEIKRIFWTYYTPESIVRGRHAHQQTQQLLFAVTGTIIVTLTSPTEELLTFKLDSPNVGLYIPPNYWHTMQYTHTAIQMVLASTEYDENDYLRSYDKFLQFWNKAL